MYSNSHSFHHPLFQALLAQGVITHAQYMGLMYMKSVLSACKPSHEGSVVAEAGSEHDGHGGCDSDGHETDTGCEGEPADPRSVA